MFGKVSKEEKEALRKRMEKALQDGKFEAAKKKPQSDDEASVDSETAAAAAREQIAKEKERESYRDSHSAAAETLRICVNSDFVEITNIRLFSIEELDLDRLTNCTVLSFRKNLIHELSPLPLHLAERLRELDLFDNKIRKVRDFFESALVPNPDAPATATADTDATTTPAENNAADADGKAKADEEQPNLTSLLVKKPFQCPFRQLVKLDLSYNQIRKVSGLDSLGGTLKELYLVENKIKEIQGLDSLINLELLELGGNRIRQIGNGLRNLTLLKQLWLGKNKITSIGDSLHSLQSLELLSLQANRLTAIQPNEFPEGVNPNLRQLYLSENGLEKIENLPLHTLETIDFSFNPLRTINEEVINVANMPRLVEFWLTDGKIDKWDEIKKLAPFSETLRTVYVERNPIEQDRRYRDKVYMILPFVTQIDSWPVVNKGNLEADRSIQRANPTDSPDF